MGCKICGRGACAAYMHSLEDQEKFDERQKMSDDVDELRREIQSLKEEILDLSSYNNVLLAIADR